MSATTAIRTNEERVSAPVQREDVAEPSSGARGIQSVTRLNAALALLRVVTGVVFIAHGGQKIFTWTLPGVTEAFAGMGIPLAGVTAPLVSLLEFFGGMALVLGLFTPVVAAGLAAVMVGAIVMVHLPAGFFLPDGIEFTLTLFATSVALALAGPGEYSVDRVLARRRSNR